MGNQPRSRKRVNALRRAPDGSAFQKCDKCGVSVPVALIDMYDCDLKKNLKRFKGNNDKINNVCEKNKIVYVEERSVYNEEPRSPFLFFMESYAKTCKERDLIEINREAFHKWKNMSSKEQLPYVLQAEKVENSYLKILNREINQMGSQYYDDEADSATVGKYDDDYEKSYSSYSYSSYDSESCDCPWPLVCTSYCKFRRNRR